MPARIVLLCVIASSWAHSAGIEQDPLPPELTRLFQHLDDLGRDKVAEADFVELVFEESAETGWLVGEDEKTVTVLRDDLIPWTYAKDEATIVPASWRPQGMHLKSRRKRSLKDLCHELVDSKQSDRDVHARLHGPGPSYRLLLAHAAWKKGFPEYCVPLLESDPAYTEDVVAYGAAAFEDLAWLHYLRGVNLLMYADRTEVVPQLRLAIRLGQDSEHAVAAEDLLSHLERMVARGDRVTPGEQEAEQSDAQRAEIIVQQLKELCCPQMSQPGSIIPYITVKDDQPVEDTPSARLKQLGYAAVPALIRALGDDTPTRTVYHWRDFHRSRLVWRISDFAWHILRDISGREFGYQRIVGFTYSMMTPEEKQAARDEIRRWYEETKDLSPDERMMTIFSSAAFNDWVAAADYFAKKKDTRPVKLLLSRLNNVGPFEQGELCEVIAGFGDATAVAPIKKVLETAEEASDRIRAGIALWELGDSSGIPVAIRYVKAKDQPYGSWDDPVWLLMRCQTDEAMACLRDVLLNSDPNRAAEVLQFIQWGITDYSRGDQEREIVGSVALADVLVTAMERSDETGRTVNGVPLRVKDLAANTFAQLRREADAALEGRLYMDGGRVLRDTDDLTIRDEQIRELLQWYDRRRGKLAWDSEKNCLILKTLSPPE